MVILFFSSLDTAANTAMGHVQQDLLWPRFASRQTAGFSPPESVYGQFKNLTGFRIVSWDNSVSITFLDWKNTNMYLICFGASVIVKRGEYLELQNCALAVSHL